MGLIRDNGMFYENSQIFLPTIVEFIYHEQIKSN